MPLVLILLSIAVQIKDLILEGALDYEVCDDRTLLYSTNELGIEKKICTKAVLIYQVAKSFFLEYRTKTIVKETQEIPIQSISYFLSYESYHC